MTNLLIASFLTLGTLSTNDISQCSNAVYRSSSAHIEQAERMRENNPQYLGATIDVLIKAMKDMLNEVKEQREKIKAMESRIMAMEEERKAKDSIIRPMYYGTNNLILLPFITTNFTTNVYCTTQSVVPRTVFDHFDRDPQIGHRDGSIEYTCTHCGLIIDVDWDDAFWCHKDTELLNHHLEVFHVADMKGVKQ